MPDRDILTDAFAGFTGSAAAEIRSPGAGAARRTVRRRRIAAVAVAAAAMLAVAGYAVLPARSAPPAQPANPLPELPTTIWSGSGRRTAKPMYSDDFRGHPAGWYQVRFECTGGGALSVKFNESGGGSGPNEGISCDGTMHTVTVGMPTDTANAWVRIVPADGDANAPGTWALRVDYSLTEFPTK